MITSMMAIFVTMYKVEKAKIYAQKSAYTPNLHCTTAAQGVK
jgi:hypothetical protein